MPRPVLDFSNPDLAPGADGRLDAPAFHRNRGPIWSVLARYLHGRGGDVLEVGSGTGQHAIAFAAEAPNVVWWPSDCPEDHRRSIEAWRARAALGNVRAPVRLDLLAPGWGLERSPNPLPAAFAAIVAINVLHITPWRAAEALIGGAASRLLPDGHLFVYGPFMRGGAHTAPSNAQFDASLRRTDPEWGVRDVDDLQRLAERNGLRLVEIVEMPANNFTLIFGRAAG